MRMHAWIGLLAVACSVSIPDDLRCDDSTPCPPTYGCIAGTCRAPGTDVGITDAGIDASIGVDVPRDVSIDTADAGTDAGAVDAPSDAGVPHEVVEIACGYHHTCALTSEGRVFCWGDDRMGAVGNGSPAAMSPETTSVEVMLPDGITIEAIAAADDFTCALDEDVALYCWGSAMLGRLGDPDISVLSAVPDDVTLGAVLPRAMAIGGAHACVISTDQHLLCWGLNSSRELGGGLTGFSRDTPGEPFPADLFTEVSAGAAHTCARTTTGEVSCWGSNVERQLGTATDPMPGVRVVVPVTGATRAIAMGLHTCVETATDVQCFGWNNQGQLGIAVPADGTEIPNPILFGGMRPERVVGNDDWVVLGAFGGGHTCGVVSGDVWCMGRNEEGQLGDGTLRSRATPDRISVLRDVTAVSAGLRHTCAIADGRVLCWGYNDRGQLGIGDQENTSVPTAVEGELSMPR